MPVEWRKLVQAQLDMIKLKGTSAHEEACQIVRELQQKAAAVTATK